MIMGYKWAVPPKIPLVNMDFVCDKCAKNYVNELGRAILLKGIGIIPFCQTCAPDAEKLAELINKKYSKAPRE